MFDKHYESVSNSINCSNKLIKLNTVQQCSLKGYSTFFGNRLNLNSPRVEQVGFTVFESIQPIFGYLEEYQ